MGGEVDDGLYVGVDVGSGSVRAALVDGTGRVLHTHTHVITTANPQQDYYEQDSEEIWRAVCVCVKAVTKEEEDKSRIKGIGFDATCSLVVLAPDFTPVTVSPTGEARFNIIMWMDHRASKEADFINSHPHKVLKFVGGKVSPEMQTPKLLWLKRHMTSSWVTAGHFFDLPDYLTFKATGSISRSLCSLTCKWTYLSGGVGSAGEGDKGGWDEAFFRHIGLEELAEEGWARIGQEVRAPGERCGGLTDTAAHMMGLRAHTPVAASFIDAHAGCLALVAAGVTDRQTLTGRLALICGTSTCHMSLSPGPIEVPGVWGPYGGAVLPSTYLAEGGISASGALVDHIIRSGGGGGGGIYGRLEECLEEEAKKEGVSSSSLLTQHLHVYPDFHGNRSPLADAHMTGMICGLSLDQSERRLALTYLATLQALAYGTRQIMEHMTQAGHELTTVLMCGGLCASDLYIQTHADALGIEVLTPQQQPSVVLGAAILGAAASGRHPSLEAAARAMGGPVRRWPPNPQVKGFHDKKYQVFLEMQQHQKKYREMMNEPLN
ncbi:FGGY carbohydrate kinase domain-containing protein-like isoform X2 [Portunus trituberculatus]|uniref:FGGY carbohydrate kinase domain-containing protein-like isoform X2 n=1 Tax=Portunus trituberculatus TaxID=210409 RepID=UPI001E1CF99C|nr:FGGY carbohydrate kinase domain-containing protein-like isoform X2 [Portunus trituberculatus]